MVTLMSRAGCLRLKSVQAFCRCISHTSKVVTFSAAVEKIHKNSTDFISKVIGGPRNSLRLTSVDDLSCGGGDTTACRPSCTLCLINRETYNSVTSQMWTKAEKNSFYFSRKSAQFFGGDLICTYRLF